MTRRARTVALALLGAVAAHAVVEATLRAADPWGVLAYHRDLQTIYDSFRESPRGYTSAPGTYRLSSWSATILPDGTRRVPASAVGAPCTLVLAGDSVTFGHGVDDADTWANLVAAGLPGVGVVNAGTAGYNAGDVLRTVRDVPGDVYLYLMLENDADGPFPWRRLQHRSPPRLALRLYLYTAGLARPAPPPDYDRFDRDLAHLLEDRRVTIVAFDEGRPLVSRVRARHPGAVRLIPTYAAVNSRADAHGDAASNRAIAASVLPIAREALGRGCGAGVDVR